MLGHTGEKITKVNEAAAEPLLRFLEVIAQTFTNRIYKAWIHPETSSAVRAESDPLHHPGSVSQF